MLKMSAGILMFRYRGPSLQVMLAHPGGPFWAKKQWNAWSIPKGEFDESEKPLEAALREVKEETGLEISGDLIELQPFITKSGKKIFAWALETDPDLSAFKSNEFQMEWPPRSGTKKSFPEIDRLDWFDIPEAGKRIQESQLPLINQLAELLKSV